METESVVYMATFAYPDGRMVFSTGRGGPRTYQTKKMADHYQSSRDWGTRVTTVVAVTLQDLPPADMTTYEKAQFYERLMLKYAKLADQADKESRAEVP